MATVDQELKKLNKTVEDAVNILKLTTASSAQVKAMNEKEREAIDKWLNVVDLATEREKRQRAFAERQRDEHGKFIKKQNESTEKFMGMASNVGNMFKKAAVGVGTSIKNVANGIMSHLRNFFSQIQSHVLGLFGEESEWFGILGSIKDSITGFAGSIISFIWQKTPRWAKDQIKVLKAMYALQIKQMKLDAKGVVGGAQKKGGVWGILATILLGLAAGLGAWMHRYFVIITKLPIFAKIAKMFSVLDDIPFIGRLFKAVKFGFKFLGYPLTIILSLIDFIKAYKETEGSTWEKIKAGLWAAIEGFIELPVRFIGWVVEKVLGWFGIEVTGVGDKLMAAFKGLFDAILFGWEQIFKLINIEWSWIAPKIKEWTTMLLDALNPVINWIIDFWNDIIGWIQSLLPESWAKGLESFKADRLEMSESGQIARKTEAEVQAAKIANNAMVTENIAKSVQEAKDQGKLNQGYINKLFSSITNNQQNNNNRGSGDTPQIRDELDYSILGISAYNGGND